MKFKVIAVLLLAFVALIALTLFFGESKPQINPNPVPPTLPTAVAGGAGEAGDEQNKTENELIGGNAANSNRVFLTGPDEIGSANVEIAHSAISFPAVLDPPRFDTDAPASAIADNELVIGVAIGKESRAYLIRQLAHPHQNVVNDQVNGQPIAVTWNAESRSAITFIRNQAGLELLFQPTDQTWKSDILFRDKATESVWSQTLAAAVSGQLKGTRLPAIPTVVTSWRLWIKAYPNTSVANLPNEAEYSRRLTTESVAAEPRKDSVVIAFVDDGHLKVDFDELRTKRVINAKVGTRDIVLVYDEAADSAHGFLAEVGFRPLVFDSRGTLFVDRDTETQWNVQSGKSEEGSISGQLRPIVVVETAAELWQSAHPK